MDEIRRDYYDQLHEQNLTRHVGTTSKPRLPTQRQLQAQNAPVKIIVYPALQTLPERIKYLQGSETVLDFCRRAEIGLKAYYRILKDEACIPDSRFYKRVAQNLNCPEEWLKNGKPIEDEAAAPSIPSPAQLPILATLGERLKWLRGEKSVNRFCTEIGISYATYYRCMKPDYCLAADIANTIAGNANVPFAWLVGTNELKKSPQKKRGKKMMAKDQRPGIVLNLCGLYTAKQLSMILTGLGEHTFDVQLNLKEKIRSYECGENENL